MANVQYLTSSHGISKRFRLNNELPTETFQDIDEILLPVVKKELQNIASIKEYSYTNDILLRSCKLKDSHNDTCRISAVDSCVDVSMEYSAEKCPLVKVYNKTKEIDFLISKEIDYNLAVTQESSLENDHLSRDLKKSNVTCFNRIEHQTRLENAGTLSESHHYKNETKFSIDSVKNDISIALTETLNNLKEFAKQKNISTENNKNILPYEDKRKNEFPKHDELKSIPQECNVRISEQFHNDGICLEESERNRLSLKSVGEILDSLKMSKLGHILESTLKECNYNEIARDNAKNLEESRLDNEQILEDSKLESTEQNQTKSKLYSIDYKMFSNVIQKARNKIKPRTSPSQPSICTMGENTQLRKNKNTLETLEESSRSPVREDYKSRLTTTLYNMEEVSDILSYCEEELQFVMRHFPAVTEILHFLSFEAECIEVALENELYKEIFADQNRRVTDENFETAAGTYDEIQKLGNRLLINIIEQGKTWRHCLDISKNDLDTVIDNMYTFFSISIEDELFDNPDLVFEELQKQVFRAQTIKNQIQDLYNTDSAKLCDIRADIKSFKHMDNMISYLVGKYTL